MQTGGNAMPEVRQGTGAPGFIFLCPFSRFLGATYFARLTFQLDALDAPPPGRRARLSDNP